MIFKYFIFFLIVCSSLNAESWFCKFEEIYKNGEVQNGILLIQNENLRYEYFNPELYTLIYDPEQQLYSVLNSDRKNIQSIQKNTYIFEKLIELAKKYPSVPNELNIQNTLLKIEGSFNSNFIKRLVIISKDLNVSIYFNECTNDKLDYNLFQVAPFTEINDIQF